MQQSKPTVFIFFSISLTAFAAFFFTTFKADTIVFLSAFFACTAVFSFLFALYDLLTDGHFACAPEQSDLASESLVIRDFIQNLHFSYSPDDAIRAIHVLEKTAGFSAIFTHAEEGGVLYADWEYNVPVSVKVLDENFKPAKNGFYFFNDGLSRCSKNWARGFAIKFDEYCLYVFFPADAAVSSHILKNLYETFADFIKRSEIIASHSHTALLAQEWSDIEKTQRFFLPKAIPAIRGLEVAAYFLPLATVSGDYYSVIPLDSAKTLLMIGDVSGKGLAAALVMGVVMNAVKTFAEKENLVGIVNCVDTAIKLMHLQEKYTVLFVGLADTNKMELRYINASMADCCLISRAGGIPKIRQLQSNCPLLGIIDLPQITCKTEKLFRGDMLLLSSDGVSEIGYTSGVSFGETELYKRVLIAESAKSPRKFAESLAEAAVKYGNNSRLRDDMTIVTARLTGGI